MVALGAAGARSTPGLDWPDRTEGLTDREAEVLPLTTKGKSNADVARRLLDSVTDPLVRRLPRGVGSIEQ